MRRRFAATVLVASVALATAGVAAADDGLPGSALDGDLTSVVAAAQSVVAPVLEPVADTVSEVVAPVGDAAAPVVDAAAQTVAPAVGTVEEAVAPVVETAQHVVAPIVETVEETVRPVVEGVAPVVEVVDETLAPVLGTVEQTLPPPAEPAGSGQPEPATPGSPHPVAGASPADRVEPKGAPLTNGSVEIPASIMAAAVAQAVEDARTSVTATVGLRSASEPPGVDAPGSAAPFSTNAAATLTQPEPLSTSSTLDRASGSVTALADQVGIFVASSASWAAASISVGVAAALTLIVLMAFPGLWLRLRAVSDRSPPFLTVSLLERPG